MEPKWVQACIKDDDALGRHTKPTTDLLEHALDTMNIYCIIIMAIATLMVYYSKLTPNFLTLDLLSSSSSTRFGVAPSVATDIF